jgi:AcrR family transcriptional regulator
MNKGLGETIGPRILNSARTLFIEHGVENVNMHQIAKMAGIGQASLYRRYTEKGDICIDIVRNECQPFFNDVQAYLEHSAELPVLDQFYEVIIRFVTFIEAKASWLCSVSRATSGYRPLQSPLYQWMRTTCRELLNKADQQGEIADVDIRYTTEILLAALHNIDFHTKDQEFSTQQVLTGLHRIFIQGLKQ